MASEPVFDLLYAEAPWYASETAAGRGHAAARILDEIASRSGDPELAGWAARVRELLAVVERARQASR